MPAEGDGLHHPATPHVEHDALTSEMRTHVHGHVVASALRGRGYRIVKRTVIESVHERASLRTIGSVRTRQEDDRLPGRGRGHGGRDEHGRG